jgi:hypothetical protein
MNPDVISKVFQYLTHIDDVKNFSRAHVSITDVYRRMDVWKFAELIPDPDGKLQFFLEFYEHLPPQGSPAWEKGRTGFGGSDIGGLIGVDRFKNRKQIYSSKLGMSSFKGNTATRWGNLFEDVLFGVTDRVFSIVSHETGSIPGIRNASGDVIQSYSPDRVASIPLKTFVRAVKYMGSVSNISVAGKVPKKQKLIVLMEGKCPITRVPNGVVPKQYTLQPQLGAFTIPIVDICLFVDGMFRKCSVQQFGLSGEYDTSFHKADVSDDVLVAGFIGFYEDAEVDTLSNLKNSKSSVKPDTNLKSALLTAITDTLKSRLVNHVQNPKADFYGVQFRMENLMSLCALCDRYLNVIYDEMSERIVAAGMTRDDEEKVVIQTLQSLCDDDLVTQGLIARLVPDALSANFKQSERHNTCNYDLSTLQYGMDAGAADSDFTHLLADAINSRFTKSGCKIHYPNTYYSSPVMQRYFSEYQDDSETSDLRAKKWLYKSVEQYLSWCTEHNKQSVGILPWKLFRVNFIPMSKDTEVIHNAVPEILRASEELNMLKSETPEIREKKMSEMFPSKRKSEPETAHISSDFLQDLMQNYTT